MNFPPMSQFPSASLPIKEKLKDFKDVFKEGRTIYGSSIKQSRGGE